MNVNGGKTEKDEGEDKLTKLYLKYRQLMFYVANQILKDDGLAEDAVQEAFIKIMNHLDKINDIECNKTKGFVVIVVERVAIDQYRKRKKRTEYSFEFLEQSLFFSADLIEPIENDLLGHVKNLPKRNAEAIMLRYYYGYSCKEIAKLLSIKESSVRSNIMRGKCRLREMGIGGTEIEAEET